MSDPLLTSLCGICHVQPPKYKCPRCGARTCSQPCVKKHKKWSSCNGERDATAFVPPAKLRTDAGIDHDYNFLTKIERSVERAGKIFAEERRILPQNEGPPNKRARLHKGQSRGRTTLDGATRPWARQALGRLASLGINVLYQPYGMSRARENTTSFNKRTQALNWQVEWCLLDPSTAGDATRVQPTKLLNKTLEHTPLHAGFSDCQQHARRSGMSQKEKAQEKQETKRLLDDEQAALDLDDVDAGGKEGGVQDRETSAWRAAPMTVQDLDGSWRCTEAERRRRLTERQSRLGKDKEKYRFFFLIPGTPSREPQKLVPAEPTDTLASILAGHDVLEFPSIYVLPVGADLPPGYCLEKRSKPDARKAQPASKKRTSEALVDHGASDEEGQIVEEGMSNASDQDTDEESGVGFEFDNGQLPLEDDETSSSGSDSDTDMEVAVHA